MAKKPGLLGKLFGGGYTPEDAVRDAEKARELLTAQPEKTSRDIDEAIELLRRAADTLDPAQHRDEWIKAKGNLAGALREQETGDRSNNLRESILLYRDMLGVLDETKDRSAWVATQVNVGTAFLDYANEFEYASDMTPNAIEAFETALKHAPDLVQVKYRLASALLGWQSTEKASDLARSAELFLDVAKHHLDEGPPDAAAIAFRGRGWALMFLAAEADSCEAFHDAVACMKRYVEIMKSDSPEDVAEAQDDLAELRENYEGSRCAEHTPFDDIPPAE